MTTILDAAESIGLTPKRVASTHGGEYASSCPICGGKDRFRIWPNREAKNCTGAYWCRQCELHGDFIQFLRDFLNLSWNESIGNACAYIPSKPLSFIPRKTPSEKARLHQPPKLWQEKIGEISRESHKRIHDKPEMLAWLHTRGINDELIEQYEIGFIDNPNHPCGSYYFSTHELGLSDYSEKRSRVWIPQGIFINSRDSTGNVIRAKVRRMNWSDGDTLPKYVAIPGSMGGMWILGDKTQKIMIILESEFDGITLHETTKHFAFIAVVGGNTKSPDSVTDYLAKKSPNLLICHDNDEGGLALLRKWQKLYPHAKPLKIPYAKDIGELIQQGHNLKHLFSNTEQQE